MNDRGWRGLPLLWLLCFSICGAALLIAGHSFIFGGPVLEPGDYAANALQVMRAKEFQELLGNYSRWHFHHPGPIFFYLYALSEYVFYDLCSLVESPHQAHVLGGIILQSAFIAFACVICAKHIGRSTSAFIMLASILVVTGAVNAGGPSSIWPPHVLFGPFLLMCVAAASAFMGRTASLYLLVIAGCFCAHGHVAQPLFVAPIVAFALFGWWIEKNKSGVKPSRIILMITPCALIILLFLAPIAIDAFINRPSNIQNIISYMGADNGESPSLKTAALYVMGYWLFIPNPEGNIDHVTRIAIVYAATLVGIVLAANLAAWFKKRGLESHLDYFRDRFLGLLSLVLIGAILLSILWGAKITGPLYAFNAFYIYSLVALSLYLASERMLGAEIFASNGFFRAFGFGLVLIFAAVAFFRQNLPFSEQQALDGKNPIIGGDIVHRTVAVEFFDPNQWMYAVATVLDVARSKGVPRISNDWGFMMGEHRVFLAGEERFPPDGLVINFKRDISWEKGKAVPPEDICSPVLKRKSLMLSEQGNALGKLLRDCDMSSFGASPPGGDYVYTLGEGAVIQYYRADKGRGIGLVVEPFMAPGKSGQRLIVALNGKEIFNSRVQGEKLIKVPADCASCTLEFITPDSFSPASVGTGVDQRRLGFKLSRMSYTDMQAVAR